MPQPDGEKPESSAAAAAAAAGSDAGVYVKGDVKFIVTDDFHVAPASTSLMLTLFDKFDVQDARIPPVLSRGLSTLVQTRFAYLNSVYIFSNMS